MAGENAIVAGGGATQTAKPVRFENERSGARVLTGGGVGGVRGLTTGGRRARSEQLRGRRLERLQALVGGLESVASRIASGSVSKHQRTILMTRFNDLQRQVNERLELEALRHHVRLCLEDFNALLDAGVVRGLELVGHGVHVGACHWQAPCKRRGERRVEAPVVHLA